MANAKKDPGEPNLQQSSIEADINSSMGSQWRGKSRADDVEKQVRAYIKENNIPECGYKNNLFKYNKWEDIKMDQYSEELFKNCKIHEVVPNGIIEKYQNRVSDEIIAMWKAYGFCTTEDGYYKIVNPDDYIDIIDEIYDGNGDEPIVIFTTSMADFIVYDNAGFFVYINIRHQICGTIGNKFSITMMEMKRSDFRQSVLSWNPYEDAVKKYGQPEYDECFAYEPLLSLGGNESVDNMKKVNMKVHLDIVSQLQEIIVY